MPLRYRPVDELTIDDIKSLITNGVSERKRLDYKREMTEDKIEFLADVSSFANTSGGDLVYGIVEEKDVPIRINPLQMDDPDKEILKLQQIISSGIFPKIPNFNIQKIAVDDSGYVLVIRIPNSWSKPHGVKYNEHYRFYERGPRGRISLDYLNLKQLFILSESLNQRIQEFRYNRIEQVAKSKRTPIPLSSGPALVLHLIPLNAFEIATNYGLKNIVEHQRSLLPMGVERLYSVSPNFDGYVSFVQLYDDSGAYVQVFRNGCIESVSTLSNRVLKYGESSTISGNLIEEWILEGASNYLKFLEKINVALPLYLAPSIVNAFGHSIIQPLSKGQPQEILQLTLRQTRGIDRPLLLLPEVLVQEYDVDLEEILRFAFNTLWNSSGHF